MIDEGKEGSSTDDQHTRYRRSSSDGSDRSNTSKGSVPSTHQESHRADRDDGTHGTAVARSRRQPPPPEGAAPSRRRPSLPPSGDGVKKHQNETGAVFARREQGADLERRRPKDVGEGPSASLRSRSKDREEMDEGKEHARGYTDTKSNAPTGASVKRYNSKHQNTTRQDEDDFTRLNDLELVDEEDF